MQAKPFKKKEKLSKEENLYRSAVSLMEAVDCIIRFDKLVFSLNDAAKKFEKLGDYKDSRERKEQCLNNAKEATDRGAAEVFKAAIKKFDNAKNKSDFADIIEDLKLVRKFNYRKEECSKNIQECQRRIRKIETIATCKRWVIMFCILTAFAIAFINTPFFPLLKGMYYQSKGKLNTAINYYIESGGILHGKSKIKECYYGLAEKSMKKGAYKKALKYYKSAQNKFDAEKKAFNLEKKFIIESYPGDIVKYGDTKWILLDKIDSRALLLRKDILRKIKFDKKGSNIWHNSSLCRWLNTDYIKVFSSDEKSAIVEQGQLITDGKKYTELISILDKIQYEQYKNIITSSDAYWLKDCGTNEGNVCYVTDNVQLDGISPVKDNIAVRCSFWVKCN